MPEAKRHVGKDMLIFSYMFSPPLLTASPLRYTKYTERAHTDGRQTDRPTDRQATKQTDREDRGRQTEK